jgi:hypothetical protein
MGYYLRAFCIEEQVPPLTEIKDKLQSEGCLIEFNKTDGIADLKSLEWTRADLTYQKGKRPILVECNRNNGEKGNMAEGEINEFLEFVGSPGLSLAKRKVIKQLQNTKFIIACQLPTSDINDEGYEKVGEFLKYFVKTRKGMIQADQEGFYEGTKVIVKLD